MIRDGKRKSAAAVLKVDLYEGLRNVSKAHVLFVYHHPEWSVFFPTVSFTFALSEVMNEITI